MQTRRPTTDDILQAATIAYGLSLEDITQRSRKREIVRPRQVIHYLCKRMATDNLSVIAEKTNVKQHGTVLHSYHLIDRDSGVYSDIAEHRQRVEHELLSMGFSVKPYMRTLEEADTHNPVPNNRQVPVKVINTATGERTVANSIRAAERITGKHREGIRKECKGVWKVRGDFKFQYDV